MTTESRRGAEEARLRTLIEDRAAAIRAGDLAGVMSLQAPDVLSFDVVNPLRYTGSDRVRARAAAWFALYRGSIGLEIRDLDVTAGGDVAFCHYLYRVSGTTTEGGSVDMWVRATACFLKVDGAWTIVHEHQSVPFDPSSGLASLDLKP